MKLDSKYVMVSDLFEDTVKRTSQLASTATVLQDAIASPDSSQKSLYNIAWLMADLLSELYTVVMQLQDEHRKGFQIAQIQKE